MTSNCTTLILIRISGFWSVTLKCHQGLNFSLLYRIRIFEALGSNSWPPAWASLLGWWGQFGYFTCFTAASRPRSWLQTNSGGNSHKIGDIKTLNWRERARETRLTSAISLLDNKMRELISTLPVQSFHFSCYKSKWSFPNFSWSNEFLVMMAITAGQILFLIFFSPLIFPPPSFPRFVSTEI